MTAPALRWGAVAAGALGLFYVAVLVASADWTHLRDQAQRDWWLLAPIVVGFGTQVALTVELRRRHRAEHLAATTGAGTGASTVGMVACCAHHLADLLPVVGATGLAATLFDWRVPIMLTGIAINAAAITIAAGRLHAMGTTPSGMAACAS